MSAADETAATLEELQLQIQALKDEISELTAPGLGKFADTIRERPGIFALSALGIGFIFGYLLMRSVPVVTARSRIFYDGSVCPIDNRRIRSAPPSERISLRHRLPAP